MKNDYLETELEKFLKGFADGKDEGTSETESKREGQTIHDELHGRGQDQAYGFGSTGRTMRKPLRDKGSEESCTG